MTCRDTQGVHRVGLTVTDLEASCRFFTDLLGWDRVGGSPDYPAVFVSDGPTMDMMCYEPKSMRVESIVPA